MRTPVVIDTNVLIVANGGPGRSRLCTKSCKDKLEEVRRSGQVVLDYGYEILNEYGKKQKATTGQPGAGFEFLKWLLNTKESAEHCAWVSITKMEERGYEEFPEYAGLCNFDFSDRKFIAVAIVHEPRPPVLQAVDSKWWGWKDALLECGVEVQFLCAEEIKAKHNLKTGEYE